MSLRFSGLFLLIVRIAGLTFRFPLVIEDEETPQGRVTNKFISIDSTARISEKVK